VAQQVVSLATQSMSLPPRYEYLLEIEQSGGARCHLAIDPGDPLGHELDDDIANHRGSAPLGVGAEGLGEAGPASAVRPARARDTSVAAGDRAPCTRRLVAVHLAPPWVVEDDERRAQFAARAAAFLPLRHPNLVSTFEAVSERGQCHWVTEFVPGAPMSRMLKKTKRERRALSTLQILAIVCDVTRALEHAHRAVDLAGLPRPVVHRNVCPASVLVTYDGVVKVSGEIACDAPEVAAGKLDGSSARLEYLAPECCSGDRGDTRCDVYALGAMLWEALASRPRTLGLRPQQAVALRLRGGEPDLENVCPDVLPALAAATRRALSTDPADRHQSVGALREELEEIARLKVLQNETKGLFGFMCNHFCDEHAALQAVLEERSMVHALFGDRPLSPAGARARSGARRMVETGSHSLSQTEASATLQSPLEQGVGRSDHASGVREAGGCRSPRGSGPRRVPEASVHLPALARVFGRAESSVVVLVVAGALTALGFSWAGIGTRAAAPRERAETATVVSSVRPVHSESVHAESASAASSARFPSVLGAILTVDPAQAAPAAMAARPVPERRLWKRLRPIRGNSASRRARSGEPSEPASGTVARTLPTRDVARSSELDEASTEGAGIDLRMLNQRPPRAIDKQDPYSP
jgi:protein tyrosine kinase